MYNYLTEKDLPNKIKKMDEEQMKVLASEIREFLISKISHTGGHLASNLGIVELSLALQKSFDSSKDRIIWDVGHQSYVHKILTGRMDKFDTLRQFKGLSGFPKTNESIHDAFDTGHSSTSISVLCGISKARDLMGEDYETVAVIGDGALTGGLAYEGLNNLGSLGSKSIVILNDNGMSIEANTGGISDHLSKLRVSKGYYKFKGGVKKTVKRIPKIGNSILHGAGRMRDVLKYALVDGVFFEEMGFTYFGPIDGHDIGAILDAIELAKIAQDPCVIHVMTKKGKGYKYAENNPNKYHGTDPFDIKTGKPLVTGSRKSYSKVFGEKLCELAKENSKICAVSAAMISGTGLEKFAGEFPERTFDVGIAEGHAVTFAGGLARMGMKPVVAIYSSFLQRAFDEIIIDVCLQNLPVVFAVDRAGLVGADGESHHGIFDLSYLTQIPNMTVLAPRDDQELETMLEYAVELNKPCAIRYPRGESVTVDAEVLPLSKGAQILKEGNDVHIYAAGMMTKNALKAAEILAEKNIRCAVINPRIIKPLQTDIMDKSIRETSLIITLEDNTTNGGFGSMVSAYCAGKYSGVKVINIGIDDVFVEHGTITQLQKLTGLDAESVAERISDIIERKA